MNATLAETVFPAEVFLFRFISDTAFATRSLTSDGGNSHGKPPQILLAISFTLLILISILSRWSPAPAISISNPANLPTRLANPGSASVYIVPGKNPLLLITLTCANTASPNSRVLELEIGLDNNRPSGSTKVSKNLCFLPIYITSEYNVTFFL